MPTREIPRDKWVEFFEGFTTDHDSWLVSLNVKDQGADHQAGDTEARRLPLREIAADIKDKEHTIVISVGTSSDEMMRHEIEAVIPTCNRRIVILWRSVGNGTVKIPTARPIVVRVDEPGIARRGIECHLNSVVIGQHRLSVWEGDTLSVYPLEHNRPQ